MNLVLESSLGQDPKSSGLRFGDQLMHFEDVETNEDMDDGMYVVHVLSGPGTVYHPLCDGQPDWQSWLNRDRIVAGVGLVRRCASRIFFYNGNGEENADFRAHVKDLGIPCPVIVQDTIDRERRKQPITRTADQIRGLVQKLICPDCPLSRATHVTIVSSDVHGPRIACYLAKELSENPVPIQFSYHGVSPRSRLIRDQYVRYEKQAFARGIQSGEISNTAYRFTRITRTASL